MERIGFVMKVIPGREDEYRARHAAVWPEMLEAIRSAGCRNYSIFLRGEDLFGYLEVEDLDRFRAILAASPVNERWQTEMGSLIDPLTDPRTGFHQRLEEVFHLD